MAKFQGRKAVACTGCHTQKLKCSGEAPCHRCIQHNRECVYPKKEKFITVSENYLREIEEKASINSQPGLLADTQTTSPLLDTNNFSPGSDFTTTGVLKEPCPAELFIQKLEGISALLHPFLQHESCQTLEINKDIDCVYFRLDAKFGRPEILVKLPTEIEVMFLLDTFEQACSEYHWFLCQRFRERIRQTYSQPTSQSADRNWFCRLSLVLALGRALENPPDPETEVRDDSSHLVRKSPDLDLFAQAVSLFEISETPTLEDLEALNLIAYYCHFTNRPKTAFIYISQSMTLTRLLQLDSPNTYQLELKKQDRVMSEHMRRLWWTTVSLDKMLASELDLSPMDSNMQDDIPLPCSDNLPPGDVEQFFDAELLLAEIRIWKASDPS